MSVVNQMLKDLDKRQQPHNLAHVAGGAGQSSGGQSLVVAAGWHAAWHLSIGAGVMVGRLFGKWQSKRFSNPKPKW